MNRVQIFLTEGQVKLLERLKDLVVVQVEKGDGKKGMIIGQALIGIEEDQPSWAIFNYLPPSVAQRVIAVINEGMSDENS